MKTFKRNVLLILIICALLILGYYREFVFTSINALIKANDFDTNYSMPASLQFLENYEYGTLAKIKWILTLVFSIFYLILNCIVIKLLFNNKKLINTTIAIYVIVTVVSGLFTFTGLIFENSATKMYEFSRYLMGMLQSPVILMILIPVFKLLGNEIKKKIAKDNMQK